MMPDSRLLSNTMVLEAIGRLEVQDKHESGDVDANQYPDRPGEPDCIYYMKTGLCAYGSNCRYNHPTHLEQGTQDKGELPQRVGQPDCQYFLKNGMCKFGATCKYHHPRDRRDAQHVPLNALGLPIRQDQKSCPYFMRTGTCKYGIVCKFNHPQPATFGPVLPLTGFPTYGSTMASAALTSNLPLAGVSSHHSQNLAAYMSVFLPSFPGTMPVQQGWPAYMLNQGIASHHPSLMPNSNNSAQSSLSSTENFPERPDQPECQYYMKTGSCKFGSICKYHHPKERSSICTSTLSPLGLPLRPGEPVCSYYIFHGTCRYGPVCKFDHPFVGYYNMPATYYTDSVTHLPNQRNTTKTMKSEMNNGVLSANSNKEDKNSSTHASSMLHISPSSESTQNNLN
ncbi:zinc finger CCCH domain-containing protein 33-like isoform X2 [Phalaenopsis equestris]|uniref:zinc finger CCCH domain-containing protein 33-like isoform X2 n=1 Tax=Phalaenopsis equestris TaxID=78828 RepID=UPI0009E24EE7|nr:zinc finger CCCH domain-containing protein 33-like isoform X2 [Phalaenopsis equestris]